MNNNNSIILGFIESSKQALYNEDLSFGKFSSKENINWKEGKKLCDQMLNKCQQILKECNTIKCSNDSEENNIFSLRHQTLNIITQYKLIRAAYKLKHKTTNVTGFIKENEKKLLSLYKGFKNRFYDSKGNYLSDRSFRLELESTSSIDKCKEIKQKSMNCRISNEVEKKQLNDFLSNVTKLESFFHREFLDRSYRDKADLTQALSLLSLSPFAGFFGLDYLHKGGSTGYLVLLPLIGLAIIGVTQACKRQNLQKNQRDSEPAHLYMQKVEQQHTDYAHAKLEKSSCPA